MISNFIINFIIAYIPVFIICVLIVAGILKKDIESKNNFIKFNVVVFFIDLIVVSAITSIGYNRINGELSELTRRKDFLDLIKPMYNKLEVSDTNYKYLNGEIAVDMDSENKYLVCKGQHFFGRNEDNFHRRDYYEDFNYKLEYDEYFKILEKITNNLGGYCKLEKDIKYYIKGSPLIFSTEEFSSIDSAKKEIDKKWNENKDITSIDFKKEIKRDEKNINEKITYKYKIKIPMSYYETLNNFVDSAIIKNKNLVIGCDTVYKTPDIYKEHSFLSIIYLEQMLSNKFNVYLSN